jgi:hypothetical protein
MHRDPHVTRQQTPRGLLGDAELAADFRERQALGPEGGGPGRAAAGGLTCACP